jgi:iron complex transport system permease protein
VADPAVEGGVGVSAPVAVPQAALAGVRREGLLRRRRYLLVSGSLGAALFTVSVTALTVGDFDLTPFDVLAALVGQADSGAMFVVVDLRLPRLLLALLVGVAFALAGALFQSVLRNPLASPDIIGISQGASVGAVVAILGLTLSGPAVSLFALLGALATGAVLYAVAWRGGLAGFRFVLSGIGVAYMATSMIGYLLTRAGVQEAQSALTWLTGSLGTAQWGAIRILALELLVLVPAAALLGPRLRILTMGDETAAALGVRPEHVRLAVVGVGVCLAAVATAAVGPLAFVALTAAPIARRLLGDGTLGLFPSVLTGATLVVGADLVAQHLVPGGIEVPAGIVTGVIGGPYLIWLLATSRRGGRVA